MALVGPQATGQWQAVMYSTPYYSGSEPLSVRQAFEQRGKRNQESEGEMTQQSLEDIQSSTDTGICHQAAMTSVYNCPQCYSITAKINI